MSIVGDLAIYKNVKFDDGEQYYSVVIDMGDGRANGFDEHANKISSFVLEIY
jgi:hypothetical protein